MGGLIGPVELTNQSRVGSFGRVDYLMGGSYQHVVLHELISSHSCFVLSPVVPVAERIFYLLTNETNRCAFIRERQC